MARLDAGVPTSPLVDATGYIRPEWRAFFTSLWMRTGGAVGQSTDTADLEVQLAAEEAARINGDNNLGTALANEAVLRQQGDANEATARKYGDETLMTIITQTAGTLVPQSQLCSQWAACNLSFLPTTDPGNGQPWLDGNHIAVGTPAAAIVNIGLEDATGDWNQETAIGEWQWG